MKYQAVLVFLVYLLSFSSGAKILGLFHFNGKSHFVMFEALMKELAARGHDVTVVSHYPQQKPLPNYTDLSLKGSQPDFVGNVTIDSIMENWIGRWDMFFFIWDSVGVKLCDDSYQHPVIQKLINEKQNFDLLITEQWGSDCFLPLAYKWGIPHMSMISTMELPWGLRRYGSPMNPSFQISHFLDSPSTKLDFYGRFHNCWYTFAMVWGQYFYAEIPTDRVARKYLGNDLPHITDIVYNSSLLLINTHFSLVGNRPLSGNVIEVGGLHIPDPKPLPEELQKYLDESKNGVILFSLGSLIKAESFAEEKIQAFLDVFKGLKENVLWKFNGEVKNPPKNLKLLKWLPQGDVLAHPNVKLFITHGGLMGTQEAVYNGVPMVGIPFFADQMFNIKNYVRMGIAVDLQYSDINKANVEQRIHAILSNSSFSKNAKHYSNLFRDRPLSALETSVYWTEYLIRHKGAPHLKSAANDLYWYQYNLVDVSVVSAGLLVLILFLVKNIVQFTFSRFCKQSSRKKLKKN